jgi:hypothetical protein
MMMTAMSMMMKRMMVIKFEFLPDLNSISGQVAFNILVAQLP